MRVPFTLQQLEAFHQVAAHGSFRAAAKVMKISQPALSRTIQGLEDTVGARVFDRDTRRVSLTPVGEQLLPIAGRVLREFHTAYSDLAQFMDGTRGQVRIGALPSVGVALLPPILAQWRRERAATEVHLSEAIAEPLWQQVEEGQVDFAISVRPPEGTHLRFQHLFDDPFVMVCHRNDPLATREQVSWRVFTDRPYLAAANQGSIGPILQDVFRGQQLAPKPLLEYPSIAVGGALAAQGMGILALTRLALHLVASADLVAVPLVEPHVARPIGLLTRIGRTLPPVADDFMQRIVAESKTWP